VRDFEDKDNSEQLPEEFDENESIFISYSRRNKEWVSTAIKELGITRYDIY
jgi:hypothetical protein